MSATDNEATGLLKKDEVAQSHPVLGGAMLSFKQVMFCYLPVKIAAIALLIYFSYGYIAGGVIGATILYCIIVAIIWYHFRMEFQLWALQRPWNFIARLFLPPIEIFDSIGAGAVDNAMANYRKWGKNFCASGQVWLGSYKDVAEAVKNPQARNHWLGEHPLLRSSLPEGESGRCVFLLSLSNRAKSGTGDHEAFRKCMVDTLFSDAYLVREKDATAQLLLQQCADDYMKIDSGFDFYFGPGGGNQAFWTKFLHHVLFGMDIKDANIVATLDDFYNGEGGLTHYLDPFGHILSKHGKIGAVADLYEKSPAFANFKVKAEYNNMTKRELALLMTSIIRIAGVQGSRQLSWLATSGVLYGNIKKDLRPIWDTLDLDNEDEVLRFILEVARLSPPVTVSAHVATEPFSCEIAGSSYSFPAGTKVAIPLIFANMDPDTWGPDVNEFNHNRPGLKEKHTGFNSVNGVGLRECPGKALAERTIVRMMQIIGQKRRQAKGANNV